MHVFFLQSWYASFAGITLSQRVLNTIQFDKTEGLYKSDQWNTRVTRESLELMLAKGALNKDGVKLSAAWILACEMFKEKCRENNDRLSD